MLKVVFAVAALLTVAAHPPAWAMSHSHTHEAGEGHGHGAAAGGHQQGHWNAPAHAQQIPNPMAATADSLRTGAALYQQNCAACHGATGRGDGELAADLETAPADLVTMAPTHPAGDFAWKIANGRGEMPPWEGALTDEEIWHVVNFLKDLPMQMTGAPAHSHGTAGGGHGHGQAGHGS